MIGASMPLDFLPSREAELVTWIGTFRSLITSAPTTYGLTAGQATSYGTLATNFVNAYNVANADATRSPSNIIAKDEAKHLVVANTRLLAGIIQKFPGTTNQMRSDLGLTVPAAKGTIPPPSDIPELDIVSRIGTRVRIRLRDSTGVRRGKPLGVQGARVYSHVGPTAPVEIGDWTFEGQTTRVTADIQFSAT